ncbi:MAG: SAM-dependent methyltransferase [candidate division NC10 bacterium]|nr:SAM-dependent methyltransferase [candidate division NC10 bacterium]
MTEAMTDTATAVGGVAGTTLQGQRVAAHWGRLSLTFDGAVQALQAQGIAPGLATADALHALDMNHMGGLAATDALAEMARLRPGQRVLDVGAGVGGPARRLAHKYGARVCGVELSESVYQTAVALTALVGLQDHVQFRQGSALALPFADGIFDVVVMQHVAMQIAEKNQLFDESIRVLTPGGVLALHEIFAGPGGPPLFPLAWASEPAMSSLESWDACVARLTQRGLTVGPFVDQRETGRRYHAANIQTRRQALAQQQGAEGLSVGATDARLRIAISMERNLREGRLQVGLVVCTKGPA